MNLAQRSPQPEVMDDPALPPADLCPLPARPRRGQPHHLHPPPDAALARPAPPATCRADAAVSDPRRRLRRGRPAARRSTAGPCGAASGCGSRASTSIRAAPSPPRPRRRPSVDIEWRTGDVFDYAPDPAPDFIVTSQFTHHLADADIVRFLRWLERHAARGWFIADLHRTAFAYWGFGLLGDRGRAGTRSSATTAWSRSPAASAAPTGSACWPRPGVTAEIAWHLAFRWCVGRLQMIHPNRPQTTAAVAAHYDELDPFYREIWGEHVHHGYWATGRESRRRRRPKRWSTSSPTASTCAPGQTVCDIGCGYGATAQRLAERHGVHVTGVTVSARPGGGRPKAASRPPAALAIRHRDWLANDFPDVVRPRLCDRELRAHGRTRGASSPRPIGR